MKTSIILNQLKENSTLLNLVSAARSLNSIDDSNVALPIAFVYPVNIQTLPNNTIQKITNISVNSFAVLVACNHPDSTNDYLYEVRKDVMDSLVGFEIDQYPIEYLEGSVVDTFPKYLLWQDIFSYQSYNRYKLI